MTLVYPQPRTCPYQPSPAYEPLRDGPPLRQLPISTGQTAWVVTGLTEARALLADRRVSTDRTREGFPMLVPEAAKVIQTSPNRPFLVRDDPEHGRVRRMLISEFTVRRFKELRPDIEKIVHSTLDTMLAAGSPADLVTAFALPVPSLVISRLLGVPYEDHEFFQRATGTIVRSKDPVEGGQAVGELIAYLSALAADPPPGLIAQLKRDQVETGAMKPEELTMTALLLLGAGHETTSSTIAVAVLMLLQQPEQIASLRSPEAVEELLRYTAVAESALLRIAVEDIEIAGEVIKAGDAIVIGGLLANRDPRMYTDPDRLDLTRKGGHHLTFGYGVHQCLGQNLARMELQVALPALFERVPSLRLAVPVEELELRPINTIQGVNALPVAW